VLWLRIGEGFNTPRTEETTNMWLTPLRLIQYLGKFDFNPCCLIHNDMADGAEQLPHTQVDSVGGGNTGWA
jgi:hypothetical protein